MDNNVLMEQIAQNNNTTASEVYEEIQKVIDWGVNDPELQIWKGLKSEHDRPTPEEVIQYFVNLILEDAIELKE